MQQPIYGYFNGENFVPSKRVNLKNFKKNQGFLITPVNDLSDKQTGVKYLGKITNDNYVILSEALARGENVRYDYDDPFFSPENLAALRRSIARLEAGEGTFHDIIEVDDDE